MSKVKLTFKGYKDGKFGTVGEVSRNLAVNLHDNGRIEVKGVYPMLMQATRDGLMGGFFERKLEGQPLTVREYNGYRKVWVEVDGKEVDNPIEVQNLSTIWHPNSGAKFRTADVIVRGVKQFAPAKVTVNRICGRIREAIQ